MTATTPEAPRAAFSASGASQWELFRALVERSLRLRAKRTAVGIVWPIVAPLFLLALYAFVFGRVFDVPIRHYPEFLFAGLLPWSFLAQTLGLAHTSLSSEPDLIRRARFPYEFLPMAQVAVMALYFLITMAGFVAYLGVRGFLDWGALPFLVGPVVSLVFLVASLGMILALIDVYNRDLRLILGNLLTIWFFLVPIVYRPRMAPRILHPLRSVDPMNLIVSQTRDVLYYGGVNEPRKMIAMVVLCTLLLVGTLVAFRRLSVELPKDV